MNRPMLQAARRFLGSPRCIRDWIATLALLGATLLTACRPSANFK